MPFTLKIDEETGVVIVTAEGALDADTILEALASVWKMPEFGAGSRVLWDLRRADATGLDASALRGIAAFEAQGRPELAGAMLAFLVTRDVEFGLARMVGAFADDTGLEHRVFREHDAAWSWLVA